MKETSVSTGEDYQAEGYQAVSALVVLTHVNDSTKMTVEECLPPQDTKAKEMLKTAHFVWLYFHIANKLVKEVLCHICQIHLPITQFDGEGKSSFL